MSRRRCMPAHEIRLCRGLRGVARPRQVRPAADDGQHPPAARRRSRRRAALTEPPWNTRRARGLRRLDALDRHAALRRPRIALGGEDDPDRRAREGRQPRSPATAARRSRRAAAASTGPSATARRGRITCASGSPSRALHSSRTGPSSVSISPAYRNPTNGVPRRASSARIGRWTVATIGVDGLVGEVGQRRVGAHPAGVRSDVAVAQALVVARRRQGHGVPTVADRDDARLEAPEPLLHDEGRGRRHAPRGRTAGGRGPARRRRRPRRPCPPRARPASARRRCRRHRAPPRTRAPPLPRPARTPWPPAIRTPAVAATS